MSDKSRAQPGPTPYQSDICHSAPVLLSPDATWYCSFFSGRVTKTQTPTERAPTGASGGPTPLPTHAAPDCKHWQGSQKVMAGLSQVGKGSRLPWRPDCRDIGARLPARP